MKIDKKYFLFNLIYVFIFGAIACFFPFIPIYFQERGFSYIQSGFAYSMIPLIGIAAQPVWGYITDKYTTKKKTLLITVAACIIIIPVFIFVKSFTAIVFAIILLVTFQCALIPISDSYTLETINNEHYGRIRLMGSIGFAVISLFIGKTIKIFGINSIFIVYFLLLMTTFFILLQTNPIIVEENERPHMHDVLSILKDKAFLLFLSTAAFSCMAFGANSNFTTVLIEKTGGSITKLGVLWFLLALSELPMFYYAGRIIERFGVINVYLYSLLILAIRFAACSLVDNYVFVIAIQMLNGISYPLYLTAALKYTGNRFPAHIKASGITMLSALGFGLGNFVGNIAGGYILQGSNIFFLYRIMSLACVIALLIGIFFYKKITSVEC